MTACVVAVAAWAVAVAAWVEAVAACVVAVVASSKASSSREPGMKGVWG